VGTGVFIDLDHAVDFYLTYMKGNIAKVFVLLHGWEFVALGLALTLVFSPGPVALAFFLGYAGHMAADQLFNKPANPFTYFVSYRIYKRFYRSKLFVEPAHSLSDTLHNHVPFWGYIEPRMLSMVSKWRGNGRQRS